jgi:hypothetical protein
MILKRKYCYRPGFRILWAFSGPYQFFGLSRRYRSVCEAGDLGIYQLAAARADAIAAV